LTPVVVVDKGPVLDNEDPRGKVVGNVGGEVVEEVDNATADLYSENGMVRYQVPHWT
jgi:hypothetical protein